MKTPDYNDFLRRLKQNRNPKSPEAADIQTFEHQVFKKIEIHRHPSYRPTQLRLSSYRRPNTLPVETGKNPLQPRLSPYRLPIAVSIAAAVLLAILWTGNPKSALRFDPPVPESPEITQVTKPNPTDINPEEARLPAWYRAYLRSEKNRAYIRRQTEKYR